MVITYFGANNMAKQDVNIGVEGNDGDRDSIRESPKVNENFQELYAVFTRGLKLDFTTLGDNSRRN